MPIIDVIKEIDSLTLKDLAEIYGAEKKEALDSPKIKLLISTLRREIVEVFKDMEVKYKQPQAKLGADALVEYLVDVPDFKAHKQAANDQEYEQYLISLIAKINLLCKILDNRKTVTAQADQDAGECSTHLLALQQAITRPYLERKCSSDEFYKEYSILHTDALKNAQQGIVYDLLNKADSLEAQTIDSVQAEIATLDHITASIVIPDNPVERAIEPTSDNNKKQNSESFFKRHAWKFALAGAALLAVGFLVTSVVSGGLVHAVVGGLAAIGIAVAPAIITPVVMAVGAGVAAVAGAVVGSIVARVVSGFKSLFKNLNNNKKAKSVAADPNSDNDPVAQPADRLPSSSTKILKATGVNPQDEEKLRAEAYEHFVHENELQGPNGKMVKAVEGAVISETILRDNDLMGAILKMRGLIPSLKDGQLVLAKAVEGVQISDKVAQNLKFMDAVYKKTKLKPSYVEGVAVLADPNATPPWASCDNTAKAKKESATDNSDDLSMKHR